MYAATHAFLPERNGIRPNTLHLLFDIVTVALVIDLAVLGLLVFGHVIGQELEGNKTPELHILGLVDHPHPAAAQLLDDAVVRDVLADHSRMRAPGSLHLTEPPSASQRMPGFIERAWARCPVSQLGNAPIAPG
jgi:hypothetical protein